jgi:hypothetical protein
MQHETVDRVGGDTGILEAAADHVRHHADLRDGTPLCPPCGRWPAVIVVEGPPSTKSLARLRPSALSRGPMTPGEAQSSGLRGDQSQLPVLQNRAGHEGKLSLIDAVSLAGGFSTKAKLDDVLLISGGLIDPS